MSDGSGYYGFAPVTRMEHLQSSVERMYEFENEREELYVTRDRFREEGTPEEVPAVRDTRDWEVDLGGILAQAARSGD